jgi:hypothetical protein
MRGGSVCVWGHGRGGRGLPDRTWPGQFFFWCAMGERWRCSSQFSSDVCSICTKRTCKWQPTEESSSQSACCKTPILCGGVCIICLSDEFIISMQVVSLSSVIEHSSTDTFMSQPNRIIHYQRAFLGYWGARIGFVINLSNSVFVPEDRYCLVTARQTVNQRYFIT